MRADRPSLTATLVAGARALYAVFPPGLLVGPDADATALVPAPLTIPVWIAERAPWTAPLLHHAIGFASLGMSWHVALRTLAIDDAARASLGRGAGQIVLLGAGMDNRATRLPEAAGARVFEVDHPDMQRYKRARLPSAGVGGRIFVPVNFERDSLEESLHGAGFSPAVPTFWIWEGVTPYLTRAAVDATLRAVADNSAPGSRLALTYMRPAADIGHGVDRLAGILARIVGEPVHAHARYGRDEMARELASFGFSVLSDEADVDLARRYWGDPQAAHPRSIAAFPEWERLALAERTGA